MRRYGRAIEYDLAVRGIDLATMWRSRRWRKLLNLIDHLPRNSAYVEAIANDEKLAEQLLGQEDADSHPKRRMSEYSVDVELLSSINDRVAELISVLAAVNGVKPQKIQYSPRPVTAMERVRERQRDTRHRRLVARVLPSQSS